MDLKKFDLNDDGYIDITEIQMVSNAFGSKRGDERYERRIDFNHDGVIDIHELVMISSLFGRSVHDGEDDDDD